MRLLALILAVMPTTLLLAQEKIPPKEQAEASARRIKELRKERIAALEAAAATSMILAQAARTDLREAVEDQMTLLKVELEATEKESERIALYEKVIKSLKALEEWAVSRVNAARGNTLPLYRIKAKRLEVEILLEQARMKEGKGVETEPLPNRPSRPRARS